VCVFSLPSILLRRLSPFLHSIAPSAIAHEDDTYPLPREMTEKDFADLRQAYVDATRRADEAGAEFLEFHTAHVRLPPLLSFLRLRPHTHLLRDRATSAATSSRLSRTTAPTSTAAASRTASVSCSSFSLWFARIGPSQRRSRFVSTRLSGTRRGRRMRRASTSRGESSRPRCVSCSSPSSLILPLPPSPRLARLCPSSLPSRQATLPHDLVSLLLIADLCQRSHCPRC
jgi:hypothetical protein